MVEAVCWIKNVRRFHEPEMSADIHERRGRLQRRLLTKQRHKKVDFFFFIVIAQTT